MTEPNDREQVIERMRELGRASGRARRERAVRRRTRDAGIIAWDVLHDDPEAVFRRVFSGGNSVAIMDAIRFATEAKTAQLKRREAELEERDLRLTKAERELVDMERSREDFEAWEQEAQARYDAREAELEELERLRDELRVSVELEADAAGFEVVGDAAA